MVRCTLDRISDKLGGPHIKVSKADTNRERESQTKFAPEKKRRERKIGPMNSVFSVDEMSDGLWSSTPVMNRSSSEWALERFLEEFSSPAVTPRPPMADPLAVPSVASPSVASQSSTSKRYDGDDEVVEIKKPDNRHDPASSTTAIDSDQYREFLKNQLDLACAAVALTRV